MQINSGKSESTGKMAVETKRDVMDEVDNISVLMEKQNLNFLAENFENILKRYKQDESKSGVHEKELEIRFGKFSEKQHEFVSNINYMLFCRLKTYLDSYYQLMDNSPSVQLDLIVPLVQERGSSSIDYRVSILGQESVDMFTSSKNINTISLENIKIIKKEKLVEFDDHDFDYRIRLSDEREADRNTKEALLKNIMYSSYLRFKKRYSYTMSENNFFRYDLTIVTETDLSRHKYQRGFPVLEKFLDDAGNEFARKTNYQFEIEVKNRAIQEITYRDVRNTIKEFIVFIQDTGYFTSNTLLKKVRKEYMELYGNPSSLGQFAFMGMKPVSISNSSLAQVCESLTKENNYSVTMKADGERFLLYVHNEFVFLINSNGRILPTQTILKKTSPQRFKKVKSIFDGEYVEKTNSFYVFDIFFYENEDVRELPLFDGDNRSRFKIMKEFFDGFSRKPDEKMDQDYTRMKFVSLKLYVVKPIFQIFLKEYYFDDIAEKSKELIKSQRTENSFAVDGLIFTPNRLGYPKSGYTFNETFKWKDPKNNTIDFLVKFHSETESANTKYYKFLIYINNRGYKAAYEPDTTNDSKYIFIPYKEAGGCRTIDDHMVIRDDMIIECSWGKLEQEWEIRNPVVENGWIPRRVRMEKTMQYFESNHNIRGTANSLDVANAIWDSIMRPIKLDQLFHVRVEQKSYDGDKPLSKSLKSRIIPDLPSGALDIDVNDIYTIGAAAQSLAPVARKYYVSTSEGLDKFEKILSNFHNMIKQQLISDYSQKSVSPLVIIDFSCGQGGDLFKYVNCKNLFMLVGLDLDPQNIERLESRIEKSENLKQRLLLSNEVITLFSECDTSKILLEKTENGFEICRNNWSSKKIDYNKVNGLFRSGILMNNNRLCTSFFSLQYYFEKPEKLHNLLWNANICLQLDGYYLLTFLDGRLFAEKELNEKKAGEEINFGCGGRVSVDPERQLFKFIKYKMEAYEGGYGYEIGFKSVNISGANEDYIPEYLVDTDNEFMTAVFKKFGFSVAENHNFSYYYMNNPDLRRKLSMCPRLKVFSDCHKVIVLQKVSDIYEKFETLRGAVLFENKVPANSVKSSLGNKVNTKITAVSAAEAETMSEVTEMNMSTEFQNTENVGESSLHSTYQDLPSSLSTTSTISQNPPARRSKREVVNETTKPKKSKKNSLPPKK